MIFRRNPRDKSARKPRKLHECEWCGELLSSESYHYRCPYKEEQTDSQNKDDARHDSESE